MYIPGPIAIKDNTIKDNGEITTFEGLVTSDNNIVYNYITYLSDDLFIFSQTDIILYYNYNN